jgi:hypothetical protein
LTQSPAVAAAVPVLHQYTLKRLLCSLGNVYFTTAAAPTKAAPSSCTYNRFTALQKPPVANGKAQGFGMAVTLAPDASMIIAGVGGCFVTPGGKAPPCPNFPGGGAAAGGLPNKGDLQGGGGYKGRQPSFWLPDQLNMTGELRQDSTLRCIPRKACCSKMHSAVLLIADSPWKAIYSLNELITYSEIHSAVLLKMTK